MRCVNFFLKRLKKFLSDIFYKLLQYSLIVKVLTEPRKLIIVKYI